MEARIVISPTGQISLFIDSGASYAEAVAASQRLLAQLGSDLNIEIVIAPPEQHRHGPGFEHQLAGAATHVHADGTAHSH